MAAKELAGLRLFGKPEAIESTIPRALVFGNFDGVHLGHQKLIKTLIENADGRKTFALTFFPHPTRYFAASTAKPLLCSLEDRVKYLLDLGVDIVGVQSFDEGFSRLTADEFCLHYLNGLNVNLALLGFSVTYGQGRMGSIEHFQKCAAQLAWPVLRCDPLLIDEKPVSSSRVREAVQLGNVELAERLLGRPFSIPGTVGHGDKVATGLGFPTANLSHSNEVTPAPGVYACLVECEGEGALLPSVVSCGYRPTLSNDGRVQIEAHIFDFHKSIYDRKIRFHFKKFLRPEIKFEGIELLKAQIASDALEARKYFRC